MALYISKPIMWNSRSYVRPSGVKVKSGFPKQTGFGHEEWNNSPTLGFAEDGVDCRAFHTEGVGNLPVESEAGHIFFFMYASHDGVQELVGVAGNATCLMREEDKVERERLTKKLALNGLAKDAWAIARVQELHGGNRDLFDEVWQKDLHWIPNWRCPTDTYFWCKTPVPLDPMELRGTNKLLSLFGKHTVLDRDEALKMLNFVPAKERDGRWHRIHAEIDGPDSASMAEDILEIQQRKSISETTRRQLILARIGQVGFRRNVEVMWNGACAVTGCSQLAVLRASHIKAWSRCANDEERLDEANGLLLTANLDALFDRGLISFADDGRMLVSQQLSNQDRKHFELPRPLFRKPNPRQRHYLADHRAHWAY